MIEQSSSPGNHNSATRYVIVVTLPQEKREVKSCDTMTEALLYRFEYEAIIARAGFPCPPLKVELRAALRQEVQP
jgi:hypothetical protein